MSRPPVSIPGERNRFYSLLSEIGEDVIVILSTHIVEDVMELCTNMAIIHQGKVLFAGAPERGGQIARRTHLAEIGDQGTGQRL